MSTVIEAQGLGKRYRRQWALSDCTLAIPAGHVVGLVGPNGAGKTTLLGIAAGMLRPSAGTMTVLGPRRPAPIDQPEFLWPWARRGCSSFRAGRADDTMDVCGP
jgi:ABC-type multidrug transport system ATPase subunit